jgi:hypothetical protein
MTAGGGMLAGMAKAAPRPMSDEDVAEQICTRLEYAGRRFERGQFVAILDGEVAAVGRTFAEVDEALVALGVERDRGVVIQVAEPLPDVIR